MSPMRSPLCAILIVGLWSLSALAEISGASGTQFDPEVVQAFLKIVP